MTMLAKNQRELGAIVLVMNKLGYKFHVYEVIYTISNKIKFKNKKTDVFEYPGINYFVDASGNNENIKTKVINEIVKEYQKKNKDVEFDEENETIYARSLSGSVKRIFDFSCNHELSETVVERMTTDSSFCF